MHCWSHLRRRFVKLVRNQKSPIAEAAVGQIAMLYAVEATVRGMAPEVRLAARREHSAPIVAALRTWFEKQLSMIPSGSQLATDIRYALAHWTGLTRFLEDGRLELDTNPVENAIRPVATTHSLCPPFSSVWKECELVLRNALTRRVLALDGRGHLFGLEVGCPDLVWRARDHLFGSEDARLDQPADQVVGHPELRGSLAHGQPRAILLGGAVLHAVDLADRADAARGPSLAVAERPLGIPGVRVADVARRHGTTRWQVYDWRRRARDGRLALSAETLPAAAFAAVVVEEAQPGGRRAGPASRWWWATS